MRGGSESWMYGILVGIGSANAFPVSRPSGIDCSPALKVMGNEAPVMYAPRKAADKINHS